MVCAAPAFRRPRWFDVRPSIRGNVRVGSACTLSDNTSPPRAPRLSSASPSGDRVARDGCRETTQGAAGERGATAGLPRSQRIAEEPGVANELGSRRERSGAAGNGARPRGAAPRVSVSGHHEGVGPISGVRRPPGNGFVSLWSSRPAGPAREPCTGGAGRGAAGQRHEFCLYSDDNGFVAICADCGHVKQSLKRPAWSRFSSRFRVWEACFDPIDPQR
jgi:hypothetical protein